MKAPAIAVSVLALGRAACARDRNSSASGGRPE